MAVKKYAAKATIDDVEEVKNSLEQMLRRRRGRVYCKGHPVREAVMIGAVKLMEIIFNTSFDMNARLYGIPPFHLACRYGQTEIVRMMISCSKEKSINLNAKEHGRTTGLHVACCLPKHRRGEPYVQIKKMLEDEYAKIDVTESV